MSESEKLRLFARELALSGPLLRKVADTRARLASADSPDRAQPPDNGDIRRLIAAGVPRLEALADDADLPDAEFCERCLNLLGRPFEEAPLRRLARERARTWLFLSGKPYVPRTLPEFLSFYETANRLEPHYCTVIPARLRTAEDPAPFSHGTRFFDRVTPGPECETSPAESIPYAVDELLRFVNRSDLPAECRAFAGYFLLLRIHPFRDGNGHAARMLALALLAPHYGRVHLLALNALMQQCRHELVRYLEDIRLGRASIGDLIEYGLCLLDAASGFGHAPRDVKELAARVERNSELDAAPILDELLEESAEWDNRQQHCAAQMLLRAFFAEGFVRRASAPAHRDRLTFYGSILCTLRAGLRRRAFEDIDVIVHGTRDDPDATRKLIEGVADRDAGDGIRYRLIDCTPLLLKTEAPGASSGTSPQQLGLRIAISAALGDLREIMTIDAVTMRAEPLDAGEGRYRPAFGGPEQNLRICGPQTLIAMKLHRIIRKPGVERVNDLYDIHILMDAASGQVDMPLLMACYRLEEDMHLKIPDWMDKLTAMVAKSRSSVYADAWQRFACEHYYASGTDWRDVTDTFAELANRITQG